MNKKIKLNIKIYCNLQKCIDKQIVLLAKCVHINLFAYQKSRN